MADLINTMSILERICSEVESLEEISSDYDLSLITENNVCINDRSFKIYENFTLQYSNLIKSKPKSSVNHRINGERVGFNSIAGGLIGFMLDSEPYTIMAGASISTIATLYDETKLKALDFNNFFVGSVGGIFFGNLVADDIGKYVGLTIALGIAAYNSNNELKLKKSTLLMERKAEEDYLLKKETLLSQTEDAVYTNILESL